MAKFDYQSMKKAKVEKVAKVKAEKAKVKKVQVDKAWTKKSPATWGKWKENPNDNWVPSSAPRNTGFIIRDALIP